MRPILSICVQTFEKWRPLHLVRETRDLRKYNHTIYVKDRLLHLCLPNIRLSKIGNADSDDELAPERHQVLSCGSGELIDQVGSSVSPDPM